MSSPNTDKLAVLIDAENAQASVIGDLIREVARYGTATIKRAYGDWTTPNLNSWRETLNTLAIQPIQQFRYTVGKNATDSALATSHCRNNGRDARGWLGSSVKCGFIGRKEQSII